MIEKNTLQQLDVARASGDDVAKHKAFLAHANSLILSNQHIEAGRILDEAVEMHAKAKRYIDEAHCLHLAATAYRFGRSLDEAEHRAQKAVTIAPPNTPVSISSWTELGETVLSKGRFLEAAQCYQNALEHGKNTKLLPKAQLTLLRRIAQAQSSAQSNTRAALTLKKAVELAKTLDETSTIIRLQIEEATAWLSSTLPERAVHALEEAEVLSLQTNDYIALADLEMIRSTLAIREKNLRKAFTHAKEAQTLSLKGVDAMAYTTSSVAMSEIADLLNDRPVAYEVLAVGWATLGDLMGSEVAKETFAPKLQALVQKWGKEEFLRVKSEYEASRMSSSNT